MEQGLACHCGDPLDTDQSLITMHFESCAEENVPSHHRIGCISKRDLDILGLELDEDCGKSNQRRLCLCLGCKTELLETGIHVVINAFIATGKIDVVHAGLKGMMATVIKNRMI